MAILIKRYANRKLYNTQTSRYITLKGIAELIDAGEKVRVIDNETGEDITSVALSQILGRGGDALYDTLRKSFDDASENLGDFQDRFRRFVSSEDDEDGESAAADGHDSRKLRDWIAYAAPDFEQIVQKSMERVFKLLDLPRRSDIEALNENLERVAEAVETLEKVYERRESSNPTPEA